MNDAHLEIKERLPAEIYRYDNGMFLSGDTELEKWRAETLFTKEPETIAWIDYWSNKNGVLYDVGANIGGYSIYAAHTNPSINVISFEPVLNNYATLLKNKTLNKLDNLTIFQMALSSSPKLETLFLSDERVGNSGAQVGAPINERGENFDPTSTETLFCLSLDVMIENYGFVVPTFIKIDVDGHEIDILQGGLNTLARSELKSILIESNGDESKERIDEILKSNGFSLDNQFNNIEKHSSKRRENSAENVARNIVYSKL